MAGDLAELICVEVGKPIAEAHAEVARSVAIFRYFAQVALLPTGGHHPSSGSALLYTRRVPHGVAALITPWNFPLAIPAWKAAPALASGNAVLLKPSPDAIGVAMKLEGIIAPHLPPQLIGVALGSGETGAAVVASGDVVSFTGSTDVGRAVIDASTARGIPVQAEMGGNNAAVVLPDADLEPTARQIVGAAMGFAGQKCTATRRIIVVGRNNQFIDAVVAAVDDLGVGDPSNGSVTVGPVINPASASRIRDHVAEAMAAGATRLNTPRTVPTNGFYVEPILLEGMDPFSPLANREVFGPVAVLYAAKTTEEALRIAEATDHGLTTSIHTKDLDAALSFAGSVGTGMVKVNAATTGVDFHVPFGGHRASSYGRREQGAQALEHFSWEQTVSLAGSPA